MLTVYIPIDRRAAILAGYAREGHAAIVLEDTDLQKLSPTEREILAVLPTKPGAWDGSWIGTARVRVSAVSGTSEEFFTELAHAAQQLDPARAQRQA